MGANGREFLVESGVGQGFLPGPAAPTHAGPGVVLVGGLGGVVGAAEDVRVARAVYVEIGGEAAFDTAEGVVHEDVIAGHVDGELDHGGAAGRHHGCLHVCQGRRGQAAQV